MGFHDDSSERLERRIKRMEQRERWLILKEAVERWLRLKFKRNEKDAKTKSNRSI